MFTNVDSLSLILDCILLDKFSRISRAAISVNNRLHTPTAGNPRIWKPLHYKVTLLRNDVRGVLVFNMSAGIKIRVTVVL